MITPASTSYVACYSANWPVNGDSVALVHVQQQGVQASAALRYILHRQSSMLYYCPMVTTKS